MVVFATPERAATASTVSEPTSPSVSSSRVAARIACFERSERPRWLSAMADSLGRNVALRNGGARARVSSSTKRYGAFLELEVYPMRYLKSLSAIVGVLAAAA